MDRNNKNERTLYGEVCEDIKMNWAVMLVKILLCFLMVFVVEMQGSKGCLEKERLGLLEIKDFFVFLDPLAGVELFASWVDDREANCCGWEHIHCNHTTGRVTHLILGGPDPDPDPDPFASGPVMNFSLLYPFEQLQFLDLSHNSLNCAVEIEGLCRLKNLQELHISQNYIDSLPECMSNLTSLRILDMSLNSMIGNLSLLHPLEQLQFLDLSDNYFPGSVGFDSLEGLCGLKKLQELDISKNPIVTLPDCMGNLTSLRALDLSSTYMTGNVPSFITSLKSLEYLSLFDTNIDGFFSFSLLANHSKLVVFRLSTYADKLHVETESPPWLPNFQLKVLQLGNCNLNSKQDRTIPRFLLHQHELRLIDLSHNMLLGEFPTWLLNNNSKLETLHLKNNSLTGTLQLPTTTHCLVNLEISNNKFGGQLPRDIGKIFPNLSLLNLTENHFEGGLPSSMVEMQRVQILDLSNNKFSGELAWYIFFNWTSLVLLRLSHNNFSGHVFSKLAYSAGLSKSSLQVMDISYNMISGRIPGWIANFGDLQILSLSNNLLEAEIPKEICQLQDLTYIDLSENSLSGTLPDCMDTMTSLTFLHLQKNSLTGSISEIPDSLYLLDLRDNEFYGEVQPGPLNNSSLGVLLLEGNQLNGSIPDELCHLQNLRILDLSQNRFTGTIPSCFSGIPFSPHVGTEHIQFMWFIYENTGHYSYDSTLMLNYYYDDDHYMIYEPVPAEFRTKHNIYSYTGNILLLMTGLDLSSNELNGSIPPEIGYLGNISSLNLSHNHFSGSIPQSFSNLVQVESLDLSYNNLSGTIPPNLTELHFLAIFNVSYNNLSGRTPTTGQFANFDEDNYRGNPGLFGFVNVSFNRTLSPPSPSSETTSNEGGENHTAIELVSFYWGFVGSYVMVILGLATILWFSPHWCRVWFRFVDMCIYYCLSCFFRDGFR